MAEYLSRVYYSTVLKILYRGINNGGIHNNK